MKTVLWLRRFGFATVFILLILASYILIFTPVPQPTNENIDVISGHVVNVHEGGVNDVVITLADDDRIYYINRGLERGVDLYRFAEQLKGNYVKLHISQRMWSPLDPSYNLAPVQHVVFGQKVLFTNY